MNTSRARVAVFALVLTIVACTRPAKDAATPTETPSKAIVTVNGLSLSEDAFSVYVQNRTNRNVSDLNADERSRLIDEATQLLVVAQAAEAKGVTDAADVRGTLELQRLNTLAQNLIRTHIEENPVTEAQLEAEYVKRQNESKPVEYKARHILVADEETARSLIDQLEYGADFAELARENSTGPSASSGGDLGWFTADQMVAPFAQAVAELETGTYSKEPVKTRFGWHVILAEDVRESPPPSFDQMKDELRPQLQQQAIEIYIEGLKAAASIVRSDAD